MKTPSGNVIISQTHEISHAFYIKKGMFCIALEQGKLL